MARYDSRAGTVEIFDDGSETVYQWQDSYSNDGPLTMARFVPQERVLKIFPTVRSGLGLKDQFDQIAELHIDAGSATDWYEEEPVFEGDYGWQLVGLPDGFGTAFERGIGVRAKYRGLLHQIEEHTACKIVRFVHDGDEGEDGGIFSVSLGRFGRYKRAIDRNNSRRDAVVRRFNTAESHNAIADLIGVEPKNPLVGRHPIIQALERELAGKPAMQPEERRLLLREAGNQSRAAAAEAPAELGKLRHDIQLVTLEVLIEQFTTGLKGGHRSDEGYWQKFFELNTFALQQLFAAPVALYRPQLHVRNSDALGRGARIVDFMLINSVTRSAHIVEIKTPAAKLLGSLYRTGIYPPNVELAGAIAQLQAQIESTLVELPGLIAKTPELAPIEHCAVRGAVLAGTAESLDAEQQRSFMRYRDGLSTVDVITFDEVLARLQGLHQLLSNPPDSNALTSTDLKSDETLP